MTLISELWLDETDYQRLTGELFPYSTLNRNSKALVHLGDHIGVKQNLVYSFQVFSVISDEEILLWLEKK